MHHVLHHLWEHAWLYYYVFSWLLFFGMMLLILHRRLTTAESLAWLAIVYVRPEIGAVCWVLFGDRRLGRVRVRLHRQVITSMWTLTWRDAQKAFITRPKVDPAAMPLVLQAERATGMPLVGGNGVDLMPDNQTMVRRLIEDIDRAEKHVHLLYYIFEPDMTGRKVADALLRAANRGVACRLLADAVGSRPFFKSDLARVLTQGGVRVVAMLPVDIFRRGLARVDLRNHRKLAIIDGTAAYTGSQNIVNDDYGTGRAGCWIDLSGRFTGPVVTQLQTVFTEDWAFETDEVLGGPDILPIQKVAGDVVAQAVPTGPSHETEGFHRVLLSAINVAAKRIIITSPYLVPDEPTMLALAMAADRGVDISLVAPRRSDHLMVSAVGRSFYRSLMESGVKIFHYRAGLLHAKTITVDDTFALIGSANLDIRSFYLCFEINVLLYGPEITRRLRDVQTCYLADSLQIDLEIWKRRPFYKTYLENAAGLLAPLY
jgi:cardiolipin synthase